MHATESSDDMPPAAVDPGAIAADLPVTARDLSLILRDRVTLADLLDTIGAEIGDRRYRTAAGALRGRQNGRPQHDDSEPLAIMREMLDSGRARTVAAAARIVAQTTAAGHSARATAARLARKFRSG